MADTARKDDTGKLRYDLITPIGLEELALVYTAGANKYGDRNWEKGLAPERLVAAAMRHMEAYRFGERRHDDHMHHLASVAWCCFALMHYERKGEQA